MRRDAGKERRRRYASREPLRPGRVLRLEGRDWLVERVDAEATPARVVAKPARYRIQLRHPDGREELGAFRRYRSDRPRPGRGLTTLEEGQPVAWEVTDERLAHDAQDEPYLELTAERSYDELDELPNHELEHAVHMRDREPHVASLSRTQAGGLALELAALEPGQLPDWDEARRYVDDLILEEIEDDLVELCGVDPDGDPREDWLATVQARLQADLERFRADLEGDHEQIEEWDFRDGRVFAAAGSFDDEANPVAGYGWLCRFVDASALAAAGFRRVRKAELRFPP